VASLCAALIVGAGVAAIALSPVTRLDGRLGVFGFLLLPDTEYAPGYSDWRFLKVREGMPAAEVSALLGAPLRINESEHGEQVWIYSRSPHDTHFRCRTVTVRDGVVVGIHAEFYVD
jgi:hypothetical protein